jgi:GTPase
MPTKAVFAAILGRPNSGKSTLLNSILNTKLSIVSAKPQTTRKRVLGIYTKDDLQIVFFDNPGLLDPKYELQRVMMKYIGESLAEADVILLVVDLTKFRGVDGFFPENFLRIIKDINKPRILVLNKIDTLKDIKNVLPVISEFSKLGIFDEIIPISALKNSNVDDLVKSLEKYIPESEFYYDSESLSNQTERFFVSELIRETVFKIFTEEIPYSTEILINEFKERTFGKWYISADVVVERGTQKAIIIGEGGAKIKSLGEKARKEIEEYLQMPVYLEIFVKVREKWRNDKNMLRSFGY